jgi:hypothetical protein
MHEFGIFSAWTDSRTAVAVVVAADKTPPINSCNTVALPFELGDISFAIVCRISCLLRSLSRRDCRATESPCDDPNSAMISLIVSILVLIPATRSKYRIQARCRILRSSLSKHSPVVPNCKQERRDGAGFLGQNCFPLLLKYLTKLYLPGPQNIPREPRRFIRDD